FLPYVFTTCQTTFSVIPSPHALPERQTHLNNFPFAISAAANHSSRNCFTQSGTGNGSNVTAFSNQIHDCPMILTTLKVIESEVGQLPPSKTTAEQDGNNRAVALAFERFSIGRSPQSARLTCR